MIFEKLRALFSFGSLRRQTSGRAYVPEIDGLRFVAILSVVLFHLEVQVTGQPNGAAIFHTLNPVVHNGYRGVLLFFVISGFILGLPFARSRLTPPPPTPAPAMRLRDYFLRRITRLEPPYVVIMVLRAALMIFLLHLSAREVLPHLLAGLGYVHWLAFGSFNPVNIPVWSLEVEMQFYCIAPAMAWVFFSFRRSALVRRVIMVAAMLACGIAQMHINFGNHLAMTIAVNLQYFIAGFLLCDFYLAGWEKIRSHWLWDLVCLPLWFMVFGWDNGLFNLWLPLTCVVLYIGAFKGPLARRVFRNPFVATTGGMCYSIYLTHNLTLTFAEPLFRKMGVSGASLAGTWLAGIGILIVVFLVGLVYYVVLERPCMERDWPGKLALSIKKSFLPSRVL